MSHSHSPCDKTFRLRYIGGMSFGKTLKKLRTAQKLTMREVAARAKTSRQTVLRAEHGDATLMLVLKLMRAYNVKGKDRSDLLDEYLRAQGVNQRVIRPSA